MYGPSGHTIVVNCEFTIYISEYPSVQNSVLKYSGGVQTPVFTNYDTTQLEISGTYSATNTGEYTAIFTPKEGYAFADGSENKSVSWGIYYIWEKYNVDTSQSTVYTDTVVNTGYRYSLINGNLTAHSSYAINQNEGVYISTGSPHTYAAYVGSNDTYIAYGFIYAINKGNQRQLYEITRNIMDEALEYNLHELQASTVTNYFKGPISYGQVYSTNASEYPDNNYSGDYWYVKQ